MIPNPNMRPNMRMESRRPTPPHMRRYLAAALLGLSATVGTQIRPAAAGGFDGAEIRISGAFDLNVYFRKGFMYLTQTGAFDAFADDAGYNAVKLPQSGGKGCRKYRDGGRPGQHCYEVRKTVEGNWHVETTLRTAAGGGFPSDSQKAILDITVGHGNCKAHVVSFRRDYVGTYGLRNEDLECVGSPESVADWAIEDMDHNYLR
jgi:hypothetical protein